MSRFVIDPQSVRDESRLVVMEIVRTLMRLTEGFQQIFGPDLDRVMIVLAVGVITGERPVRAAAAPDVVRRFGVPIPSEDLVRCTALGIAAATGLPRETARRKMQRMIDDGLLVQDEVVGVRVNPDILQQVEFQELVVRHAGEIARLTNVLVEHGALIQV